MQNELREGYGATLINDLWHEHMDGEKFVAIPAGSTVIVEELEERSALVAYKGDFGINHWFVEIGNLVPST